MQSAKIPKKIYHLTKLRFEYTYVHLPHNSSPATTSNASCRPLSSRCHDSHSTVDTVQVSWICNRITVYLKSFTHKSAVSPEMIPTQELQQKHLFWVLDRKQKYEKNGEGWQSRENCQLTDSCNQHTQCWIMGSLLYSYWITNKAVHFR
jgi:hypothetical protein